MARKKATRKKVTLQYIHKDSTRRASFKDRLGSLMNKARELSILGDVDTCVLVYGEGEAVPEVFPSPAKAVDILNRFNSMPELGLGHCKKTMMNQEAFLTQRINKLRDQVDKARRECRDRKLKFLLHKAMLGNLALLADLSIEDLTGVGWKVDVLLRSMGELMAKSHSHAPPPALCLNNGSIDAGSPGQYQAPPQQQGGYLDMVSYGGDLGPLAYGTGDNDGAGFSSGGEMMMQPFDLRFGSPPM